MSLNDEAEALIHELFLREAGRRDPHPRFHRLRQVAPVHYSEALHSWVLTRFEDCHAVLRDPRFGKRFAQTLDQVSRSWRSSASLAAFSRTLLQLDTPDHTRLRRRAARSFTARRVLALRPTVVATVSDLLDQVAAESEDLMEALAFRLPITVIGEFLGLAPADLLRFRQAALDLTAGFEIRVAREDRDRADAAMELFDEYFTGILAERRAEPGTDLLSALADPDDPDPLTDREFLDLCVLLLVAGFETTTNVISNGLMALHDQPDQFALLRSGEYRGRPVEELLRHESTLRVVNRVALEDIEVGGRVIRAGDQVLLALAAANRDPAVFDEPDRLDFDRDPETPLVFGGGAHHCLGAALARLELEVLLEQLAERFEAIELTGARPRARDRLVFAGLESLPLRLRPAAPATAGRASPVRPGRSEQDLAWRAATRRALESGDRRLSESELGSRIVLLRAQPALGGFDEEDLADLARTAYVVTFARGQVLIRQGAVATDAYVLLEGSAAIDIDGVPVGTAEVDDVVGERGVVTRTPRAATVTALEHVAALALSHERLIGLLDARPAAAATMLTAVAARYPDVPTAR